ncbi:TRAP transporter substrate-binding protein [Bacillus sp. ISL-37]|uniref:TRAP transporter substrate-binding protein n=1 Tax=Bacillus sp. ISL-37 TaxID=2819123 RepID=UPI001BEBAD7D|nr:TRAP transporter substrate-binding protein [Bacillus sp. ISL-37]MBT2686022.1 TRAP transporter substrate-binding protein [Bacillus sp. ISL-37]
MKTIKRMAMFLLLVSFVMGGCSNSSSGDPESDVNASSDGAKVTIKFAHSSAPGSARDLGAKKFKEVVEAETDGKVKVEIYPASQLGNPTEIVQGVQSGSIEMAISPTAFMGGFEPLITLLDIPFLLPDDKDKLLELQGSDAMRQLLDKTENVGIKTLGIWHTGYKQFTGPKALTSPDEFKGLKFRAMPSPVIFEQFKTVGASPADLPFAETYNALQNGTIDAQENPLDTTYDMKMHEVQEVATITNHGVLDQLIIVNKGFYDSLDQEIKAAMEKAFEEGQRVTVDKTYKNIEDVRKKMEGSGMEFVEITPEQRVVFVEKMQAVRDFYITKFGDEGEKLLKAIEDEL